MKNENNNGDDGDEMATVTVGIDDETVGGGGAEKRSGIEVFWSVLARFLYGFGPFLMRFVAVCEQKRAGLWL
ncbi:MAG: hypothetical protein WKF34_01330 [Pyrinomonadaceae bacterium]